MLIRIDRQPYQEDRTHGVMSVDGAFFGHTLELPWKENKKKVSCIPAGVYPVSITYSPKFGKMMLSVQRVPKRDGIRIHAANFAHQLLGCIAVAKNRGTHGINGELATALKIRVADALKRGEAVTLEIINPEGK